MVICVCVKPAPLRSSSVKRVVSAVFSGVPEITPVLLSASPAGSAGVMETDGTFDIMITAKNPRGTDSLKLHLVVEGAGGAAV